MNEDFSFKSLIKTGFFSLSILFIVFYKISFQNNTKVVFCNVGQGDATYIRIRNHFDLLVDAGPDKKILTCLGQHMPFYDKTIDAFILSHPQKDHYGGLKYILEYYKVKRIYLSPVIKLPRELALIIRDSKLVKTDVKKGDRIKLSDVTLLFLWPGYDSELFCKNDENCLSLIFLLENKSFKALFTGDTIAAVLNLISRKNIDRLNNLNILKVPHHGSVYGLNLEFLKLAKPMTSVISVGKNNSYGHPTDKILELLKGLKTKIKRTDKDGDVVIKLLP